MEPLKAAKVKWGNRPLFRQSLWEKSGNPTIRDVFHNPWPNSLKGALNWDNDVIFELKRIISPTGHSISVP